MNETKKPLPIFLKAILIYTCSFVLGLLTSWLFGKLYRYIIGSYGGDTIFIIGGEGLNNFLGGLGYGYLFFVGLFISLFIKRKIWLVWLIGFMVLGWLSFWSIKDFGASVGISLFGLLLGKLILLVYKKIKK
jgi:hypothetical protein